MASTYANAHTSWRVRTDGNELNGGGFDSSVTGAGIDYTDQASPQISSTTGTCTVGSTTWTDTGVTFTSDMVGNVIRISAKTGGDATALDYFVVTGYTDANNITLDRSPCAVANITAATYRLGGAHASLVNYASTATGLSTPALSTPLIPGNRIYIRGSGSLDPASNDYDWSAGKWTFPSGTKTAGGGGVITLIGYNGRPRIAHCGALITANWDVKHVSFYRSAGTYLTPVCDGPSYAVINTMTDCIFDQGGFASTEWYAQHSGFLYNEVRNTGGGAASTTQVIALQHPSNAVIGNYIHGVRGPAVAVKYAAQLCTTAATIAYNTIVNNLSDGIQVEPASTAYYFAIFNNTIDANGGHGIKIGASAISQTSIFNNIISNHVGASKYAVNFADSYTTNRRLQRNVFDANCYYGNTTNFNQVSAADAWVLQANDITLDPEYADAAGGDYATGSNVRNKGLSGLGGVGGTLGAATNIVNIGAYQGAVEVTPPTPEQSTPTADSSGGGGGSIGKNGNQSMYKWLELDTFYHFSYFGEPVNEKKVEEEDNKQDTQNTEQDTTQEKKNSALISKEQARKLLSLSKPMDKGINNTNFMTKTQSMYVDLYKTRSLPKYELDKIDQYKRKGYTDELSVLYYLLSKGK